MIWGYHYFWKDPHGQQSFPKTNHVLPFFRSVDDLRQKPESCNVLNARGPWAQDRKCHHRGATKVSLNPTVPFLVRQLWPKGRCWRHLPFSFQGSNVDKVLWLAGGSRLVTGFWMVFVGRANWGVQHQD